MQKKEYMKYYLDLFEDPIKMYEYLKFSTILRGSSSGKIDIFDNDLSNYYNQALTSPPTATIYELTEMILDNDDFDAEYFKNNYYETYKIFLEYSIKHNILALRNKLDPIISTTKSAAKNKNH